jgi:hypothetical protein
MEVGASEKGVRSARNHHRNEIIRRGLLQKSPIVGVLRLSRPE